MTTTDANGETYVTVYDGLDRLIVERIPDPQTGTLVAKNEYVYTDASGNVNVKKTAYLNGATTTTQYTYLDGFRRKIQERSEMESVNTYSVRDFSYGTNGLISKESLPYESIGASSTASTNVANLYTHYAYDPLNRVTVATTSVGTTKTIRDQRTETVIDALGNKKDYLYDAYGHLTQVKEYTGTSTYTTLYTWDTNNNLIKITDALGNVRNITYDALNRRLTLEDLHVVGDTTFGTWTFTYDLVGNPATTTNPKGQIIGYSYDALDRLLTENFTGQAGTEVTYTYDSCTKGVGRLCTAVSGGGTTTYGYDHNDQRVKKVSGGVTTLYPNKYFEVQGATTTSYVWAGDDLIATVSKDGVSTSTEYIHEDHLGSTNVTTNELGEIVSVFDYYPFGEERISTGDSSTDRHFIGERFDAETEMSYLNARYYEGSRGQFLSQDPTFLAAGDRYVLANKTGITMEQYLMDPQGLNSYSYARNNPIKYKDASGEWYWEFITGQQSWSSFSGELGDAAYQLGEQSSAWDYAMDHPYKTGAAVGVGSGLAAYGTVALITSGSGGLSVGQKTLQYRDGLLQGVNNTKLSNIIRNTYKGSDTIEGGTFGALRNELTTGNLTKGLSHAQKAEDTLRGLSNVLKSGKVTQGDLNAISKILNNIQKELNKVPKKPTPKGK